MTNYEQIELDFMSRTAQIIDQYEELVLPRVGKESAYEVTLLMNCLLGLLIYPQQLASRREHQKQLNSWLTEELVVKVGKDWGIDPSFVKCAGFRNDGEKIQLNELTLRNLIRQMRNAAAHARFSVDGADRIEKIIFKDGRPDGFEIEIPVQNLELFVKKLANSAAQWLSGPQNESPHR